MCYHLQTMKKSSEAASPVAELEKRIAALKAKVRDSKEAAPGDAAARALHKKLRRAQRRRRSLIAFDKSLEARRAGKKTAAAPAPSAGAPVPAAE